MRQARIGILASLALVLPWAVAGPAQAATGPVTAVGVLYSTGDPAYEVGRPLFGDNQRLSVQAAYGGGFAVTVLGSPYWSIEFHPPTGSVFGVGRYTNVSNPETFEHASATLYIGSNSVAFDGEFEIRDWAMGTNGRPSRFDVVFRTPDDYAAGGYFGQVRLGQDAGYPVSIAARSVLWPDTPVGSTPILAKEWLHNPGSSPVAVGAATIVGDATSDYTVRDDGCTARTLPAGATCSFTLGFSPRAGGPRVAALRLPLNGVTKVVALSGTAPLGTTGVTTSGNDYVDQGAAYRFTGRAGHGVRRAPRGCGLHVQQPGALHEHRLQPGRAGRGRPRRDAAAARDAADRGPQ